MDPRLGTIQWNRREDRCAVFGVVESAGVHGVIVGERAGWQRHLPFAADQPQESTASGLHVLCRRERLMAVLDRQWQLMERADRRTGGDQDVDPSGGHL